MAMGFFALVTMGFFSHITSGYTGAWEKWAAAYPRVFAGMVASPEADKDDYMFQKACCTPPSLSCPPVRAAPPLPVQGSCGGGEAAAATTARDPASQNRF
ncbi:hypothetical protein HU200_048769 [Digitaria exilis]|uniref:Uncharacterized protein n=1 Tax=Digitaria exilis TaxID=1010633 RepID=A0A835E796_9POAL|nr:hypothetical protein HU200_048769 [Digitaria exilis]